MTFQSERKIQTQEQCNSAILSIAVLSINCSIDETGFSLRASPEQEMIDCQKVRNRTRALRRNQKTKR